MTKAIDSESKPRLAAAAKLSLAARKHEQGQFVVACEVKKNVVGNKSNDT
jgi:hypothetical protein